MSDLHNVLERLGERATLPPGAMERVVRRRARQHTMRRVTAGSVALLLTAASTIGLYRTFGSNHPRPVHPGGDAIAAFWPEITRTDALAAQARVDAGQNAWRKSPRETAAHFAESVLGWHGVQTFDFCAGETADLCKTLLASPKVIAIGAQGHPGHLVGLQQFADQGAGGIWSVSEIRSDLLHLPVWGGDRVHGNADLQVSRKGLTGTIDAADAYQGTCELVSSGTAVEGNGPTVTVHVAVDGGRCPADQAGDGSADHPYQGLSHPVNGLLLVFTAPRSLDAVRLAGELLSSGSSPEEGELAGVTHVAASAVVFVPPDAPGDESPAPPQKFGSVTPSPDAFAVWPEDNLDKARETQKRLDNGDRSLDWRLDPEQVAKHFVTDVMHAEASAVSGEVFPPLVEGFKTISVDQPDGHSEEFALGQRVREGSGGIWSVIAVQGETDIVSISVGTGHDEVYGHASGHFVQIEIDYTGPSGTGSGNFPSSVNDTFEFRADLTEYVGSLAQGATGYILIGVPNDAMDAYADVTAIPLPPGPWSAP